MQPGCAAQYKQPTSSNNEAAKQTALQTRIAADTYALRRMYATTNPAAALELDRAEDLKQRIDACCPPRQPQPLCVFEPCPAPAPSTNNRFRRRCLSSAEGKWPSSETSHYDITRTLGATR